MITKVVDNKTAKQVRIVSIKLRTLTLMFLILTTTISTCFWIYHQKTISEREVINKKLLTQNRAKETLKIKTVIKDEKLPLFLSELSRVRSYEKSIKLRFEAIRNVVRSIMGTDLSIINKQNRKQTLKAEEKGIGGLDIEDNDLVSSLDQGIDFLNSAPIGTPLDGNITSGYGYRISPFTKRRSFHTGLDIAISKHSSVLSTADGIVTYAGLKSGYGNIVEISHKQGYKTLFAHLSAVLVQPGQKVCREQIIGLVGMTGRTTGPHLHYEIRKNNIPRNPKPYIALTKLLSVAVD